MTHDPLMTPLFAVGSDVLRYSELIELVGRHGDPAPSRYGETREVIGLRASMPIGVVPLRAQYPARLGVIEGLQFVGGYFSLLEILDAAPHVDAALFDERGSYGLRASLQLELAVAQLTNDPKCRQAVVFVGDEHAMYSTWAPCTATVQVLVRGDALHLVVTMRSWDLLKGLPADLVQFSILGLCLARALGKRPGLLTVTAASAHTYDVDLVATRYPRAAVAIYRLARLEPPRPPLIEWRRLRDLARACGAQAPWGDDLVPTEFLTREEVLQ